MNTERKIIVLVVDDSPVVRQAIRSELEKSPIVLSVITAPNGHLAIKKTKKYKPDVITMDVEMPGMNGIQALEEINKFCTTPVIMLSAYTAEGQQHTLKALEVGAVDFIQKPDTRLSRDVVTVVDELIEKIIAVTDQRTSFVPPTTPAFKQPLEKKTTVIKPVSPGLITIGASTGGTRAIREILMELPPDLFAGIVIVQHMPANFTGPFAQRLDSVCKLHIKEAQQRDMVQPGRVLIAPGHSHVKLKNDELGLYVELTKDKKINGHRPSVDVLFQSVPRPVMPKTVAVLLTGMGRDGADGLLKINRFGGHTIAQDASSSTVYGMPRAAVEINAANKVLPLKQIAQELIRHFH